MKCPYLIALLLGSVAAFGATKTPTARSCEQLAGIKIDHTTVTLAQTVENGSFNVRSSSARTDSLNRLPAFCRVAATLKPTPDSDIKVEVWMPMRSWNGKFEAVGNGGWGGAIGYKAMAEALRRGYATAATDDGHEGEGGAFVLGHPEKFIDFAYRSEHGMTLLAKAMIHSFYSEPPRYSYWKGCSGGGREALIEAHRFPGDFDGIIAGDPADFRRNAWALALAKATFANPANVIPASKLPMIHKAVLEACDGIDGLKDGLIDDPRRCHFDPAVLQCKAGDEPTCLTSAQVDSARALLNPVKTRAGEEIFPRLEPGTELRWGRLAGGPEPAALFQDLFRYVIYQNPKWDWHTFDLERDYPRANQAIKNVIDLNPDLRQFAARGGKLLIYHGWADQQVAPVASLEFYTAAAEMSGGAANWLRLFMAPGMAHCSGGEGPNRFDAMSAMERWVEKDEAPRQMIASHLTDGKVDRTRPLCPYPEVAKYKGTGSIDEAQNFRCSAPAPN
jgi:feruloyl esterase